jgi:hypothetical protein
MVNIKDSTDDLKYGWWKKLLTEAVKTSRVSTVSRMK